MNDIFIFFTTHWDREWYLPFQKFRSYLIDFFNKTLELFEKYNDFPPFYLDGQFIPLEDYLEIYPEKKKYIINLCKNKRIFIGPWYTMPDTNIVNGESIFRNLEIGIKESVNFGVKTFFGFLSDIFGHPSQIPQILNQFDINTALLWRGVDYNTIDTEFYWCYPDNNNVDININELKNLFCLKAYLYNMEKGYGDAWIKLKDVLNKDILNKDILNVEALNNKALNVFDEIVKERLSKSIINIPLIQIGVDHCYEDEKFYFFFKDLKLDDKYRINYELSEYFEKWEKFSNLKIENYIKFNKKNNNKNNNKNNKNKDNKNKNIDNRSLKIIFGELREVSGFKQKNFLIPYIGSSRIDLKHQNFECENLLIYKAEPLIVFLNIFWDKISKNEFIENKENNRKNEKNIKFIKLINHAWKILLKNHAHDSIGGCSIDQVHKDMNYRFDQVKSVADSSILEINKIINHVYYGNLYGNYNIKKIRFINTLCSNYNDYTVIDIRFIKEVDGKSNINIPYKKGGYYFHYEKIYLFDIIDQKGNKIEYDILRIEKDIKTFEKKDNKLPVVFLYDNYRILLPVEIDSFSFKDYFVIPTEYPSFYNKTKFAYKNSIENDYLRISINKDGTLDIYDKVSETTYMDQLKFRIDTDIGDGYNFYKPINGTSFYLNYSLNNFEVKNYKNKNTLILHYYFNADDFFKETENIFNKKVLFDEKFKFTVFIDLYNKKRFVNFKTVVNNNIENIRFSVYFPFVDKNNKLNEYFAYTPYDIVKRKLEIIDDRNFTEPVPEFGITNGFVFFSLDQTIALFSKGNPEMGIFKDCIFKKVKNRIGEKDYSYNNCNSYLNIMGLTLYRSFSKTVFTNGQEDGKLKKKLIFEFSLRFFDNTVTNTEIINEYLFYINSFVYYITNIKINKNLSNNKSLSYINSLNNINNVINHNKSNIKNFNKRESKNNKKYFSGINIKGSFVINSIRMLGNNIIFIRGYNPEFSKQAISIEFNFKVKSCFLLEKLYNKDENSFFNNFINNPEKDDHYNKKDIDLFLKLGEKLNIEKNYKNFNTINFKVTSKKIVNLILFV